MFFPLVVLVAVLPGLYALNSWDLTPPSPWWGLRGLVVLDGMVLDQVPAASEIRPVLEARTFRTVAFQPPLVCLAGGDRAEVELPPRPAGDRLAELRGGGVGGRAGLPARQALARAGPGAGRGLPDRLQPQPADPDAAGGGDDAGAGRDARGPALLRLAPPRGGRDVATGLGMGGGGPPGDPGGPRPWAWR